MLTIAYLNSKRIENYEYEEIYEGMKDGERNYFLKQLYAKSKAGEIHAYCTCIEGKKIPLVVSKREKTYYIKRQDASVQHSSMCKFDGEYIYSLKGWDIQQDGTINVSLKDRMYSTKSFVNPKLHSTQLSLNEFTLRYMGLVWELQSKYFLKNNKGTLTFNDYYNGLFYWGNRVRLSETVYLKDVFGNTKSKAYSLLKKNLKMFMLMRFEKKEKIDKTTYMIYLKNPDMTYSVETTCPVELWNEAMSSLAVKKAPLMIGGFVELLKDKPLNFTNIAIIPISNEGVHIKTEYERKLINALHKKKRHFVNSYETFRTFGYTNPNALLLDTNPMTIVEIFEKPKSDIDYYGDKERKLYYYQSLNKYKLVVWDGYNNEPLFKF